MAYDVTEAEITPSHLTIARNTLYLDNHTSLVCRVEGGEVIPTLKALGNYTDPYLGLSTLGLETSFKVPVHFMFVLTQPKPDEDLMTR